VKKLSWLVGVVALLGSGGYLFVYIYRWEWHRALLVGTLFLATLVGLCTALVMRRLAAVAEQARSTSADQRPPGALERLRAAPVQTQPFRWLSPEALDRSHIFIPVLLGGGFLVSGIAWLVERVAGSSARAGVEEELAAELEQVAFPATSLVPTDAELLGCGDDFADDAALRVLLGPAASELPR
jgi:H+/Cl- antiporter ClcA